MDVLLQLVLFPYPSISAASGILDMTPTLIGSAAVLHKLGMPRANLPPLSLGLLVDRLADLYEAIFPDQSEWLLGDGQLENEQDAVTAVTHFLQRVNTLFPVHAEGYPNSEVPILA